MPKNIKEFGPGQIDFKGLTGTDYGIRLIGSAEFTAKIELKDGQHSVYGLMSTTASIDTLSFGDGSTDVWLSGPIGWGDIKIDGEDGDHRLLIEAIGDRKADIKLGDGDSAVILETGDDNTQSKISGGTGDFSVLAGGLYQVVLGEGSHFIHTGVVGKIEIGAGNSQVSFESANSWDQIITAGDGNHLIAGEAVSTGAKTTITLGDGTGASAGSALYLAGAYDEVEIRAGAGAHLVHLSQVSTARIELAKDAGMPLDGSGHKVVIGQITEEAELHLGDGGHTVRLETRWDDDKTTLNAGDGNATVRINGGKSIALGDGDHLIDAGEVQNLSVGSGSSRIQFETGATGKPIHVAAQDGDHVILGTGVGLGAMAEVAVGAGNSTIQLTGPHLFDATRIKGGTGDHTVYVENANGIDIDLKSGNQTVMISRLGFDGAELNLDDGRHLIDLGTVISDRATTVETGDGDTWLSLNGAGSIHLGDGSHLVDVGTVARVTLGHGNSIVRMADGQSLRVGDGSHNIRAGSVAEIVTGHGTQQVYFEARGNSSERQISTLGAGGDLVVGMARTDGAEAKIKTDHGDDRIAILGNGWHMAEIDGGSGFDVLYVAQEAVAAGAFKAKNIEQIVILPEGLKMDDFLARLDLTGVFSDLPPNPLLIDLIHPVDVQVPLDSAPVLQDFDLVPAPDPDGLGAAVDLILDRAPLSDSGAGSREDRLMESNTTFFLKVKSYEETYKARSESGLDDTAGYNEFGDYIGTDGDDVMTATNGSSFIFAMAGNDLVEGGNGGDCIYGGAGDDTLRGGNGQDLLDGGVGNDILVGGQGIDVFIFRSGDGITEIADFELSHDILDVEGFDHLTYEALTLAGRQAGDDVIYDLGEDMLILRGVELATMIEADLCIK